MEQNIFSECSYISKCSDGLDGGRKEEKNYKGEIYDFKEFRRSLFMYSVSEDTDTKRTYSGV